MVTVKGHKIDRIDVIKGAPCGATWQAVKRLIGARADEAAVRMGLETQYFCVADPAGWDPIWGKSPVHLAGDLHRTALVKALKLIR